MRAQHIITGWAVAVVLALSKTATASEPPGPCSRRTGLAISEIMYHPPDRADKRNIEFVEIYNSDPVELDIGGFRLAGDVAYTLPNNTIIAAGGYMAIAAAPSDVQSVYGLSGVLGPYAGKLPNRSGVIRLLNRNDAVLLDVEYRDDPPWPVEADGAGHSLALKAPSYGEADVRAWGASRDYGGSPGQAEPTTPDPYEHLVINELLAHTDWPAVDFIELFNAGTQSLNVSGFTIGDSPDADGFVVPIGTVLPAGGFLSFTETGLGFSLSASGEEVFLREPLTRRVVDAVRFGAQANGVSWGRHPDGGPLWGALAQPTPGATNRGWRAPEVAINEIMYHPPDEAEEGEYIELYNPGATPVNIGSWQLADGVAFTFPSNTVLPANGYLVVAKDTSFLIGRYAQLSSTNTMGPFKGKLSNRGERIALARPDDPTLPDRDFVLVDEVTYADGGTWGAWADGGGSSLELMDPRGDNRLAANWADSDETAKAWWVSITHTGVLDHGRGECDEIHLLMLGTGECLVDNIEVRRPGGPNLVANGTFDTDLNGWTIQGNHIRSAHETNGYGGSAGCLRLRASGHGDTGANRVESDLSGPLFDGETVAISARARWLRGHPDLLLRLRGNYLEAPAHLPHPTNPGTPGMLNSRYTNNAAPAIFDVRHAPVLPAAGQDVVVSARVDDPDDVASVMLRYRIDPSTQIVQSAMTETRPGSGLYRAVLPGRPAGALTAFHVRAADLHGAAATFPEEAPRREGLVRFGETSPGGTMGRYRIWMTASNLQHWIERPVLSNEGLPCVFVADESRVIYHADIRTRGSPHIRQIFQGPTNYGASYTVDFDPDERYLGSDELHLDGLVQPSMDHSLQREHTSFWMAGEIGLPWSHMRYVRVYLNGMQPGPLYSDTLKPGADYLEQWFPDDAGGDLFKIDHAWEFDDMLETAPSINATLEDFTTTGGAKKQARYRWNWEKRRNKGLNDSYQSLFDLVNAVNHPEIGYEATVEAAADADQWMGVFALQRVIGNWDVYGSDAGKNMYAYKPAQGRWKMLPWDMDLSLGAGDPSFEYPLFGTSDPTIQRMYEFPAFRRMYWRYVRRLTDGPMSSARAGPLMQRWYTAFTNHGLAVESPQPTLNWIAARRAYLLDRLNGVACGFDYHTSSRTTNLNVFALRGAAPIEVAAIRVNGRVHAVTWLSDTEWLVHVPLNPGTNTVWIEGLDAEGQPIPGASQTVTIVNHLAVLHSLKPTAAGFQIGWTAETGAVYRLERIDNLIDADWIAVSGDCLATATVCSVTDAQARSLSSRFYRVVRIGLSGIP